MVWHWEKWEFLSPVVTRHEVTWAASTWSRAVHPAPSGTPCSSALCAVAPASTALPWPVMEPPICKLERIKRQSPVNCHSYSNVDKAITITTWKETLLHTTSKKRKKKRRLYPSIRHNMRSKSGGTAVPEEPWHEKPSCSSESSWLIYSCLCYIEIKPCRNYFGLKWEHQSIHEPPDKLWEVKCAGSNLC